jgi:hypothetical protein
MRLENQTITRRRAVVTDNERRIKDIGSSSGDWSEPARSLSYKMFSRSSQDRS